MDPALSALIDVGKTPVASSPVKTDFKPTLDIRNVRVLDNLEMLSEEDLDIICDFVEEGQRSGHFERIFPLRSHVDNYSRFFESQRHNNQVLWAWLRAGEPIGQLKKVMAANASK